MARQIWDSGNVRDYAFDKSDTGLRCRGCEAPSASREIGTLATDDCGWDEKHHSNGTDETRERGSWPMAFPARVARRWNYRQIVRAMENVFGA